MTDPLGDLYRLWNEAEDRDRTTWPAELRCPSDCARCCERSAGIAITSLEAERLARGVDALDGPLRERIRRSVSDTAARLLDPAKTGPGHLSGPCPLLENGRCAVYEDRPLPCRAYGFSVEAPSTYFGCEILAPVVESAGPDLRLPSFTGAWNAQPHGEDPAVGPLAEMLDRLLGRFVTREGAGPPRRSDRPSPGT